MKTLVVLCLSKNLLSLDENVDNLSTIETKNYEFYKARGEIADKCELDEMYAYTLRGDAQSIGDANEVCPSIEGGQCCG